MRITALVVNYGAPMAVYRNLPKVPCSAACARSLIAPSWGAGINRQRVAFSLCMQNVAQGWQHMSCLAYFCFSLQVFKCTVILFLATRAACMSSSMLL